MSGSCGCSNQTNSQASHFVCSDDYTHRRIAPMIVNNKVAYDTETFIASKVPIPERSSTFLGVRKRDTLGMIFNNKAYKLTSSEGADVKKQTKFNHAEEDTTSDNNVSTNIPLANFSIFNRSKKLYNSNKPGSTLNNTTYGKHFSQERYLMKKKKDTFVCEQRHFIC
tara:strand:+ start:361 stop:861 length:501 start_codon:yes stop_codon:yes gene_type:complete